MRVAVELPLFQAVCATDGNSITTREIAKSQDVKEDLVVCIMRALTAVGVCDESAFVITRPMMSPQNSHQEGLWMA